MARIFTHKLYLIFLAIVSLSLCRDLGGVRHLIAGLQYLVSPSQWAAVGEPGAGRELFASPGICSIADRLHGREIKSFQVSPLWREEESRLLTIHAWPSQRHERADIVAIFGEEREHYRSQSCQIIGENQPQEFFIATCPTR